MRDPLRPVLGAEQAVHQLPGPLFAPCAQKIIHAAPWGQVMGEPAPRTAPAYPRWHRGVPAGSSRRGGPRLGFAHEVLEQVPFFLIPRPHLPHDLTSKTPLAPRCVRRAPRYQRLMRSTRSTSRASRLPCLPLCDAPVPIGPTDQWANRAAVMARCRSTSTRRWPRSNQWGQPRGCEGEGRT